MLSFSLHYPFYLQFRRYIGGGNEILFVVDESEKAADATTAEGSYKGHTTTAAEVMGISNGIENETLYIILVVAFTVLVLAAAIVLVVIMLKKAKQNK